MKINISPKDCRFIVNEEKRKVICIIENTRELVLEFTDYYESRTPIRLGYDEMLHVFMPDRFVGIATCSLEDEWNEEIGRALAYKKAKYKLNISLFKRGNWLINYLDRYIGKLVGQFDAYGERITQNNIKAEKKLEEKLEKIKEK